MANNQVAPEDPENQNQAPPLKLRPVIDPSREKILILVCTIILGLTEILNAILFALTIAQIRNDSDGGDPWVIANETTLASWERAIPADYKIDGDTHDGWWRLRNTLLRISLFAYGAPVMFVMLVNFKFGGGNHKPAFLYGSGVAILSFISMCFDAYDVNEWASWCEDLAGIAGSDCNQDGFIATTVIVSLIFILAVVVLVLIHYSILMSGDCTECKQKVLWPKRRSDLLILTAFLLTFLALIMILAGLQDRSDDPSCLVPLDATWDGSEYWGGWPYTNTYGRIILTVAMQSSIVAILLQIYVYKRAQKRGLQMCILLTVIMFAISIFVCAVDVEKLNDYSDVCDNHNDNEVEGCYRCECDQTPYYATCFFDFIVGVFLLLIALPLYLLTQLVDECTTCGSALSS
eukprot:TRINITY_DN1750_c0_g1::TRINITY_DN1750_c0_g1_i1::g.25246::m.25246 TRINITY_DN1750_c0_g1::TRINITY_DN1750_c0_g1_i1::g.25246  ORF type:complete len:405 (+),score=112.77,DUF4131/PF13567.1/0.2,DUF4131/PF13567.1/5.5,DUF4131/PF13567.1/4.1e+03,Claudin_2/PF13903.1/4e+02,Claudin_2/PF13903.1/0.37,DUF3112/PF11309.3/2.2e+03,DUF3112/PF11309.3/8.8,DUF3112/PF11309.3/2.5,DUF1218/PF06749.7/1e+04,DUF1218/PF06749.7/1.5e+04,DUF1218/PF06749.7/1.6,DUF1218/PF06749.7/5.7e+03,SP_C-Propep/PF08999.5/5.3,SP_C-Propep/PF08999.5/